MFRVQLTKNKLGLDKCISTSLSTHFALYGEQKYVSYKFWQFRFCSVTENLKVVENLKAYSKTIEAK